jgi:hypothetical protein
VFPRDACAEAEDFACFRRALVAAWETQPKQAGGVPAPGAHPRRAPCELSRGGKLHDSRLGGPMDTSWWWLPLISAPLPAAPKVRWRVIAGALALEQEPKLLPVGSE